MAESIPPLRASMLIPMDQWDWDHLTEMQRVVLCVPEFPHDLDIIREEVRKDPLLARESWDRGMTLLHHAAAECHLPLAATLLEHGATVDAFQQTEGTPLHYAAKTGYLEMIRLLLEHGAAVRARDGRGLEPLYGACIYHHDEAVKLLLAAGAEPDDEYSRDYVARLAAHGLL